MCGRFINLNKNNKLIRIFSINKSIKILDKISYNISPSQLLTIITNNNFLNIELANWGLKFIDKNEKTTKIIINSRLETIKKKMIFSESFEKRKCIIPANGYYEWKTIANKKFPFFVHMPDLDTIFFAGIWKYFYLDNTKYKFFLKITKNSNNNLEKIHNRMPVIFNNYEANEYLKENKKDYLDLNFISEIENDLIFYKVSQFVNNPKNNSKECINPIN